MQTRRRLFIASFTFAALLGQLGSTVAQNYPSRPISLVVPYAAGGPADTIARIVAERMKASLGQAVIVENVVGAGGSIGAGRGAQAHPDGYTMVIGNWSTHVANGVLYSLPYDVMRDFEPISLIANELDLIVAKKAVPARNLLELIAWLKANSSKATGGTSGIGGPSHVAGILFQKQIGTSFPLVPYRGAGPAMQDLVAGQVDVMITGPSVALPHLREATIRTYAVTAKTRITVAPDIPTTDEAGLPGFHIAVWQGLWLPPNTPGDVVAKLNAAVRAALADPPVRRRLADLALEIPTPEQQGPEALRTHHKAEIEKWWPIIRAAGIKGE